VDYLEGHEAREPGATMKVLREMKASIGRADRIVKGLLHYAAPVRLRSGPEWIGDIVDEALNLVRHELARVRVVQEVDPSGILFPFDRNRMVQVFVNLFTNAAHAMPEGGTMTVRARVAEAGEGRGTAGRPGNVLSIDVEDTGAGLPPEHLDRLCDPFFTTKPPNVGTGLGLTVTKSIVELHGGVLEFANRPEGGARVSMRFCSEGVPMQGPWTRARDEGGRDEIPEEEGADRGR
jgi:two-component system, NtrC family, sensor kinase